MVGVVVGEGSGESQSSSVVEASMVKEVLVLDGEDGSGSGNCSLSMISDDTG
jgi:hypothetical protein